MCGVKLDEEKDLTYTKDKKFGEIPPHFYHPPFLEVSQFPPVLFPLPLPSLRLFNLLSSFPMPFSFIIFVLPISDMFSWVQFQVVLYLLLYYLQYY